MKLSGSLRSVDSFLKESFSPQACSRLRPESTYWVLGMFSLVNFTMDCLMSRKFLPGLRSMIQC